MITGLIRITPLDRLIRAGLVVSFGCDEDHGERFISATKTVLDKVEWRYRLLYHDEFSLNIAINEIGKRFDKWCGESEE